MSVGKELCEGEVWVGFRRYGWEDGEGGFL